MLVDHMGAILFPQIVLFRVIGRIAFPIFSFLIVEGYFHTRDVKKYLFRLGVFALVSEIPFDLAIYGEFIHLVHQNIFLTLFNGLLAIAIYDRNKEKTNYIGIIAFVLIAVFNTAIFADYQYVGILIIFGFYKYRGNKVELIAMLAFINCVLVFLRVLDTSSLNFYLFIPLFELLAIPFILFFNGQKGISHKYFFYAFYPGHLLILWLLSKFI